MPLGGALVDKSQPKTNRKGQRHLQADGPRQADKDKANRFPGTPPMGHLPEPDTTTTDSNKQQQTRKHEGAGGPATALSYPPSVPKLLLLLLLLGCAAAAHDH